MSNTFFRKASLDSISSPEQLNDYIKVSNPNVWMVLIALFVLLGAVLAWSITGSLPTSVRAAGVMHGGSALCYVNTADAGSIKVGQAVKIQAANRNVPIDGRIAGVGTVPLSASEIAADLKSDYFSQALSPKGFAVKVAVSLDSPDIPEGTLLNISIVTDAVRPIDFLLE